MTALSSSVRIAQNLGMSIDISGLGRCVKIPTLARGVSQNCKNLCEQASARGLQRRQPFARRSVKVHQRSPERDS